MSETLTSDSSPRSIPRTGHLADFLFFVLAAGRPPGDSTRHSLADLDEVVIGRGGPRGWHRDGRRLTLCFDDLWMSEPHARLCRRDGRWRLDCGGAKNSGYQNGRRIADASLDDGDVIELGHSFFVFRAAQPVAPGEPLDLSAASLRSLPAGLRSLSPKLRLLFDGLRAVAPAGLRLVIAGETGSGKELLARAAHDLRGRGGPFIAVNCATLPPTLAESELFGFRKGAFSDATEDRPGLVRSAHGGTLFLDEVVELRPSVQASLLRVLQEREVVPLGSTRPVRVDFQLIVASHCDLDEAVASGRFREDLRARLHGLTARMPPLRERREDMGVLLDAITASVSARALLLSRQAVRELLLRPWPRNIRELVACLDVGRTLAREGIIEPHHLRGELLPVGAAPPAHPAIAPQLNEKEAALRDRLDSLLREHHGNVTHVARALGKRPTQIYRWLDRCGLDPSTYR